MSDGTSRGVPRPGEETPDEIRDALEWLVNLHYNVGKDGQPPIPEEWDDAIEAGVMALKPAEDFAARLRRSRRAALSAVGSPREPSEEAIGEAHEVFVVGIRGGEVPRHIWAALDAAINAAYAVDFGPPRDGPHP